MSGAFPTLVEVLEMHARQIEQFGGSAEIRDLGLLEAAIFRAQSGYYPDVIAEAAAMWESPAQNHPFVDGNKRTALATTLTFLGMNGVELTADKHQLIDFILSLYDTHEFIIRNVGVLAAQKFAAKVERGWQSLMRHPRRVGAITPCASDFLAR